jgi:hypothetical protein
MSYINIVVLNSAGFQSMLRISNSINPVKINRILWALAVWDFAILAARGEPAATSDSRICFGKSPPKPVSCGDGLGQMA